MKSRKLLSLALAILLVFSLAACGQGSAPSGGASTPGSTAAPGSTASGGGSTAPAAKEIVKPDKVHWMTTIMLTEEDGMQHIIDKYKELTGITLQITKPAHNQYFEKIDLAFATGDAPDVIYMDANYRQKYGGNGALWSMNDAFDANENCKTFDMQVIEGMKVDGNLYALPMGTGNGSVTYYRKDWLDALNMKAPTNYDQFLEMLRGFKQLHPDKIPYTAPGIIYDEYPIYIYTQEFFLDAKADYVEIDGVWYDGFQQPNMQAALERFRGAFAEGLIDKELVTNNTSTARDKIFADMCGVMNYWAGPWCVQFNQRLQATNPNGVMEPLPAIEGVTYYDRVSQGNTISKSCKNPEGVFEWFVAYMYDQGPAQMLFTHGVEGITYEINPDGTLKKLPSLSNPEVTNTSGTYLKPDLNANNWTDDPYKLDHLVTYSKEILNQTCQIAFLNPISAANDKSGADIQIARKEFVADVVYGNKTFDEAYAKYLADAGSQIEAVLADFNK